MKELINGNEAIALAAIKAGLNFYASYPITPASEILQTLSKKESKDFHVFQMEDEIASIHAAIGASLAGARVMTATSGPGFCLKQEGIGLAYKLEVPLVIVDVQRMGPSTGMPTKAGQGDILQSKYGTHGDVSSVVFYPNSVEELYQYTIKSFSVSEELSTPVILLSDAYLANLYETAEISTIKAKIPKRKIKPLGTGTRHFTGLVSENDTPQPQDLDIHKKMVLRLKSKIEKYNEKDYEFSGNTKSDTLIICFGSISRLIAGLKKDYAIFRPIRIFPLINDLQKIADKFKKIIVIEQNLGQYQLLVESQIKRKTKLISFMGYVDYDKLIKEIKDYNG